MTSTPWTAPLLTTKIRVPRPRAGLVARPRLCDRLDADGLPVLTLVSAPAGFGKTTLLTEWIATAGLDARTAWVQLDPSDDDPARFWGYVVAALETVAPEIGADSQALLTALDVPAEVGVSTLLNELDAVEGEVLLVLDDFHVVESLAVQAAMRFFVEHLPPQVRLVVAGRTDPSWPLATYRARGMLREVRVADLRFTESEAEAYLNGPMELGLATDHIRTIEDRTEGWVAALQLAALSMQGRDDVADFIAEFAGDDRYIVDYLVGEVLDRQTEHDRNFLLHTSILSRLAGPLCDAVTGRRCAQETLERLDRTNLFVLPLDDRRVWYRYHHLFAEMLRGRLREERPDEVATLHRRASEWFEADGDLPEAITHALAADDFARAAALVERAAPATRRARQDAALRAWLEALPHEVIAERPVLAMALVGARMATGDPSGAGELLDGIERWLLVPADALPQPVVVDTEEYRTLPVQVAIHRAGLALLAGDTDGTIAFADRALDLLDPGERFGHGAATALQGLASWTTGDLVTARARYEEALADFVAAGHLPDLLGVTLGLADIEIARGALHDAVRTLELGLDRVREHRTLRGTADLHVGLAEVRIEQGDLAAAEHHLDASRRLGVAAGLPQHPYRSLATEARLRQVRGDLRRALELLDAAEQVVDTDFSPAVRPVPARRARVWIEQGDVGAALQWAATTGLRADDALSYLREFEHVTLARTLLAAHEAARPGSWLEDAAVLLERLLVAADEGGRAGAVVEVSVLLARARHALGDHDGAAAALHTALQRAAPQDQVQVFVEEWARLTPVLARGVPDGAAAFVERIGAATRVPALAPSVAALVDPLSERELDVLRLLRTELSGPDIARELYVSLNTLRTHTKAIYSKLGVNSRRAAVRRADELGL